MTGLPACWAACSALESVGCSTGRAGQQVEPVGGGDGGGGPGEHRLLVASGGGDAGLDGGLRVEEPAAGFAVDASGQPGDEGFGVLGDDQGVPLR